MRPFHHGYLKQKLTSHSPRSVRAPRRSRTIASRLTRSARYRNACGAAWGSRPESHRCVRVTSAASLLLDHESDRAGDGGRSRSCWLEASRAAVTLHLQTPGYARVSSHTPLTRCPGSRAGDGDRTRLRQHGKLLWHRATSPAVLRLDSVRVRLIVRARSDASPHSSSANRVTVTPRLRRAVGRDGGNRTRPDALIPNQVAHLEPASRWRPVTASRSRASRHSYWHGTRPW